MMLKSARLLVTPTSFGKGDPTIRAELEAQVGEVVYNPGTRPLTSAELAALLPGCDGYIAGLDAIDRAALQAADRLKVIARYGTGVDNVDLAAANERGIMVTNTPGRERRLGGGADPRRSSLRWRATLPPPARPPNAANGRACPA